MKPGVSIRLLIPLLALGFTACVSTSSPPDSSASHPANPKAETSPRAAFVPMLMAGAEGLVLPLATNEVDHGEHQHNAAGQGAQTPAQKPAEHKHEHEKSKETSTQGVVYTCPHHPEVKQSKPGECPKCGMKLEAKK